MSDEDEFMQAQMYDKMINWDSRLQREIPVIDQYFNDLEPLVGDNPTILDVACSSGRHSFALNKKGYQTVGFDISPHFIELAQQIQEELSREEADIAKLSHFIQADGSGEELLDAVIDYLRQFDEDRTYVDGAILLGNAIANMGNYANGKALLKNIFILLRPGGRLFMQTVNRPEKPWYNPLRQKDGVIIQRIMVPDPIPQNYQETNDSDNTEPHEHNTVLHVNQINPETVEYVKQKADNRFFMYRIDEFKDLAKSVGFIVRGVHKGYEMEDVADEDGETLVWELMKPEIPLIEEGIELFQQYAHIGREDIIKRTLKLWQASIRENWYHCVRGYRFLYPRIISHPKYEEIIKEKASTKILDLACHTGTDLRQMYVDGARKLYGLDISEKFIELGFELFGDKEEDRIEFVVKDALDDEFLDISMITDQYQEDNLKEIDIEYSAIGGSFKDHLRSFGLIHAGSLLHLLSEQDIIALIKRAYLLLEDGGIFFGRTVGLETAGEGSGGLRYLHSTDTLRSAFNAVGYSEVEVVPMPKNTGYGEATTSTTLQLGFYAKK